MRMPLTSASLVEAVVTLAAALLMTVAGYEMLEAENRGTVDRLVTTLPRAAALTLLGKIDVVARPHVDAMSG